MCRVGYSESLSKSKRRVSVFCVSAENERECVQLNRESFIDCSCIDLQGPVESHSQMDMEVAGQWRREWAGKAEYGNEVVGGVTRRVARAMEVLNASAPGARVRVMRAAYHSTAGPGIPASSYLMHSSRQVISSGNHFLEPSSLPMKPLEISSTPFESSHDSEAERENYKVTEPDDFDISEPSKWKGSTSKNSIRLPSEESSSTDNASIIDLDSRVSSRNTFRRSFRRKEDNIIEGHRVNSRVSPLLDAPVALSTLKYTSLLNGSEDWNNRRKSFSFEDPAPSHTSLNKSIQQGKEKLTIDSSTDSGICKSSEIVDDQKYVSHIEKSAFERENKTFQDWLCKNRSYKAKPIKLKHLNDEHNSSNISLKSTGKVTITLPITIESDTTSESLSNSHEDNDRKIKRVEFCKTELHFAAETGTVNIIATDEKPPPTNDFRKKRSAFVPLNDRFDKPITLFGERTELLADEVKLNVHNDENTAATKSILKNKIPKPKPYLLGENMVLGDTGDNLSKDSDKFSVPTTVSLINRQLQSGRRHTTSSYLSDTDKTVISHDVLKTTSKGLENHVDSNHTVVRDHVIVPIRKINKPASPLQVRTKGRDLRHSDLAYFGIGNDKESSINYQNNLQEEIFHSVKLVQQVSNSVSNSEIDSDEAPEYENLSTSNLMIPTPKPRSKYKSEVKSYNESKTLNTIPERSIEAVNETRKSEVNKCSRRNSERINDRSSRLRNPKTSITNNSPTPRHLKKEGSSNNYKKEIHNSSNNTKDRSVTPLYMNFKGTSSAKEKHSVSTTTSTKSIKDKSKRQSKSPERKSTFNKAKDENLSDKSNNIEKIYSVQKEQIDRLATPKHRIKHEGNEHSRNKKETLTNKNLTNDVHDENGGDVHSTSDRRKLIDNSKQILNKSIKNNDKENKRDTFRDNSNIKIQGSPVQLEMKSKHNGIDLNNRKKISLDKPKKKRSEYVINYDDKNGTVSSVRKINAGTNSHRRRKTSIDSKESPLENTRKDKVSYKIASLQQPDQQTIRNKLEYKNRKKKSNVNIQNTCQLL